MIIKVALNGARTKVENPNIPIKTDEILKEAQRSVLAGAQQIHFHVRDNYGSETLEGIFVAKQISVHKQQLPTIKIGISTGEWIEPNFEKRKKLIKEWTTLPDFVSVNFGENNFEQIIKIILYKGIGVEAGISKTSEAKKLIATGLIKQCFRVLIEPQEQVGSSALQTVSDIEKIILPHISEQEILLHGVDKTYWPLIKKAFEKNYSTRIGFEDTIYIDKAHKAQGNADLVKKAFTLKHK